MVIRSRSRRLADREGSAVKNAGGNGGKHIPKQYKKVKRLPTRLYVSSAGSLSFPMETRTENTVAVNVISGTDF